MEIAIKGQMSNEPYEIIEESTKPMIRVCASCFPRASILDMFPELRHEGITGTDDISHGICKRHKDRFMTEILGGKIGIMALEKII